MNILNIFSKEMQNTRPFIDLIMIRCSYNNNYMNDTAIKTDHFRSNKTIPGHFDPVQLGYYSRIKMFPSKTAIDCEKLTKIQIRSLSFNKRRAIKSHSFTHTKILTILIKFNYNQQSLPYATIIPIYNNEHIRP